jgi:5'-3' exonuclease
MACEWLLIDGSSLIFRAYYGALASARVSGTDGNAVGGFLDRLARLVTDRRPRRLVIAEDWAWRPQWRVDLIAGYKAHRVSEPVPPGLVGDLPVIGQLLEHIGIDVVGVADYEAEDVIATLTKLASGAVEIASGDRDLFALVQDPRVRVLYPERSGLAVIDEAEITRRYDPRPSIRRLRDPARRPLRRAPRAQGRRRRDRGGDDPAPRRHHGRAA